MNGAGVAHNQRKLADKSAVSIPAARFFIDVDGVGGRVLRKSVRRAADVSRCPSTPVPPNFSKMRRKHHTSLLEGLRQCAPVFPDSAALLGHAKGQGNAINLNQLFPPECSPAEVGLKGQIL